MAKERTVFSCQQCGQSFGKWMGRCTECGAWNSVVEERVVGGKKSHSTESPASVPLRIQEIQQEKIHRLHTGLSELDNVLGGGIVPGSVVLIGGEPGIGKSTLLLQTADMLAKSGQPVLYVSGEESPSQIALRAQRVGTSTDKLWIFSETNLERIVGQIDKLSPSVLILDSIQTIYSQELESQPGTVGQLRESTFEMVEQAKTRAMATFLVGHVTKEGAIAGPKVLEHMVDVVLYFEGTNSQAYRILRSMKNRFGATNEVGIFEITAEGMKMVTNPSEYFLSEKTQKIAGSVIGASIEGSRPLLVEVQALVSHSPLTIPRRTSIGLDPNRLSLLVAILEKRAGFKLYDQDVYLNIAGGLRLNEPALDLAVVAALISSFTGKTTDAQAIFFGEVGLGGEVRSCPRSLERLKEAKKVGLSRAYVPKQLSEELKKDTPVELVPVSHVRELVDYF